MFTNMGQADVWTYIQTDGNKKYNASVFMIKKLTRLILLELLVLCCWNKFVKCKEYGPNMTVTVLGTRNIVELYTYCRDKNHFDCM